MPDPEATIFARILDGEIPCHRVYEDDHVLAFLDVGPISRGHTLLIPKERVASLHEMSPDAGAALGRVLPRLAGAIVKATGADAYNVLLNNGARAGQEVMHVHVHVIPAYEEAGLRHGWKSGTLDADDAATLIASIDQHL
ncbi:MAG: HIT family protein [Phycisphaerales bacterium]|nr:HIT family protein [Phycisphaerae bacterium]NNF42552.1 HIT family protein [Phycisphaerales bacterium]NNM25094.1 HIT family protein [Phycisphaerales bacterium]